MPRDVDRVETLAQLQDVGFPIIRVDNRRSIPVNVELRLAPHAVLVLRGAGHAGASLLRMDLEAAFPTQAATNGPIGELGD